ncbi:kelch-like protein 40 [Patella vulgata]|uniref:kelch-like protein 40 n=1 Tax=Patella vulgata TaxID=6465 RepID=UPI00218058A4|nr:kelch-like protein 40 [Patella vulgata]
MTTHSDRLIAGLKDLYESQELIDVILVADDRHVPCHRNILAACSPYFRAMFTMEVCESDKRTIQLHEISPVTLTTIVDYIYTGQVDINNSNVQSLLTAANMMQIESLTNLCIEHTGSQVDVDNCVDVFSLADVNGLEQLKSTTKQFIFDHFEDVAQTDTLSLIDLDFMLELMAADELNTEKEERVFEVLERWVEFDYEARSRYFPIMFQLIRLPLIEKDILTSILATNRLIRGHPDCQDLLVSVINKSTCSSRINSTLRKGMFTRKMLIFSGGTIHENTRSFTCFDPDTRKNYIGIEQQPTFDSQFKVDYFKLIVAKDATILFLGGILYDKQKLDEHCAALTTVYKYAQQERSWLTCSPMQQGRCSFAVCSYHGRVYVLGGAASYPRGRAIDHVEFYDTEMDTWQKVEPMPLGISHHAAATFSDFIYVLGGIDDDNAYLNTVLMYSISRDTWTLVQTELLRPRADGNAVTYHEKIYLLGGADKLANNVTMEIYDPVRNRWSYGADFPEERKIMASTLFSDCIYVSGGFKSLPTRPGHYRRSRTVETRDLFKYDLMSSKWSREVKMIQYGSSTCCVAATLNINYLSESEFISQE